MFIDESGLSEKCPVTRTWGLRGHTPVIQQSFTWKQMSAIAALSWWRFYFRFFRGSVKSEQIIEFLGALRRTMGRKLLVIWDGVGCHKSRQVRQWLEAQNGQIAIAFLPPYAVTNRHIGATRFSAYRSHCAAVTSLSWWGQSWFDLAALARLRGLVGASLGARNDWPSRVRQ